MSTLRRFPLAPLVGCMGNDLVVLTTDPGQDEGRVQLRWVVGPRGDKQLQQRGPYPVAGGAGFVAG